MNCQPQLNLSSYHILSTHESVVYPEVLTPYTEAFEVHMQCGDPKGGSLARNEAVWHKN